jgi:beta-galactosidase
MDQIAKRKAIPGVPHLRAFASRLTGDSVSLQNPRTRPPTDLKTKIALAVAAAWLQIFASAASASSYTPPDSPRAVYNFNPGWKFIFGDVPTAAQPGFDDSAWAAVSLPHTWNDTDSYRAYIRHGGGDTTERLGIGWYRKHFKLPASADGQRVFLEFDGLRQAGHFFLNGQPIGKYENGVTPVGFDITKFAKFGGQENILAVQVDNRTSYREEATNTPYLWNAKDFNPDFGGLNRDATLIVTGNVYQTLPLYENLQTSGIYIYPENIDVKNKTADIHVEAEVRNDTTAPASATLTAVVVDADGAVQANLAGSAANLVSGTSTVLNATGQLANARFWDIKDPNLYDVYSVLSVNGKVVDVCKTQTGFRKVEYKGGAGTGGVWLNDHFVWLTGYAQRSANDWPGVGGAYPDWMHDFTIALIRASNGNYIRWMHVAPQRADVVACDKEGVAIVCPAGDKERDVTGPQWDQRVAVMRDSMIYYRNNPSISFWEAGNTGVSAVQMQQMVGLRKQYDPHGDRVMGSRSINDPGAIAATEYFGTMLGRPINDKERDQAPMIETEDFRDEAGVRLQAEGRTGHSRSRRRPGHLSLERRDLCRRRRGQLYQIRAQPHRQPRPRALEMGRVRFHLLHRFRRRRAPGRQRSAARERQDGWRAPAQGNLFRVAGDAKRAARHPHHRPLDLPGQHGENRLCRGEPLRSSRVIPERQIPRRAERPM